MSAARGSHKRCSAPRAARHSHTPPAFISPAGNAASRSSKVVRTPTVLSSAKAAAGGSAQPRARSSALRNYCLIPTLAVLAYPILAAFFNAASAPYRVEVARAREVPVEPTEFEPDTPIAVNTWLQAHGRHLAPGKLRGQETFVIDPHASTPARPLGYAFTEDGWLHRVDVAANATERLFFVGGRVLGSRAHPSRPGVIIGCDVPRGLVSIDTNTRRLEVLAAADDASPSPQPILFCDDVEVARDGTVYFSDAADMAPYLNSRGHWTTMEASMLDFFRGYGTGRLLKYDPVTHSTSVLLKNLYFANGVTLNEAEDAVLVAETFNSRIIRYSLKPSGRRPAGFSEVLVELPGPPDGISRAADGSLWVAIPTLRSRLYAIGAALTPLRWLLGNLPSYFWPPTVPYGLAIKYAPNGRPLGAMHDPTGTTINFVTSVTEYNNVVYFGQLHGDSVPFVPLPQQLQPVPRTKQ